MKNEFKKWWAKEMNRSKTNCINCYSKSFSAGLSNFWMGAGSLATLCGGNTWHHYPSYKSPLMHPACYPSHTVPRPCATWASPATHPTPHTTCRHSPGPCYFLLHLTGASMLCRVPRFPSSFLVTGFLSPKGHATSPYSRNGSKQWNQKGGGLWGHQQQWMENKGGSSTWTRSPGAAC